MYIKLAFYSQNYKFLAKADKKTSKTQSYLLVVFLFIVVFLIVFSMFST